MLATLTAVVTLVIIGTRWAASEIEAQAPGNGAPDQMSGILGLIAFLHTAVPTLTILPALTAVIIGEIAKIRSPLYYIVSGGVAMAVMPLVVTHPEQIAGSAPSVQYISIYATAGFAGGFVYWLSAGRNA